MTPGAQDPGSRGGRHWLLPRELAARRPGPACSRAGLFGQLAHGRLCRQLSGHTAGWGGQVRARPAAPSNLAKTRAKSLSRCRGRGDVPPAGLLGTAPAQAHGARLPSAGPRTRSQPAGPGGGCGGPASRVFVTPLHTEHPHPRRQNKGTPEKEAPLHTQGVPRARRRTLACGRLSREVGAPRMRAPRGCRRPEDAGAPRRRAPWDEPLGSHGITQHTHHPGPRNPLWGFTLGHDARRGKTAGQRAGRGGHPKRSREGEEDGRTEAQLRGSCTL